MILYGLTGGVGMGKSTAEGILSAHGVPVLDTDKLARDLVEPGQTALAEIASTFGPQIIDENGRLRRTQLAELVFGDKELLKKLEAILHPRIKLLWQKQVAEWRTVGIRRGVVSIPLLFETMAQSEFDKILCVACSPQSQHQRLRQRGWTDETIQKRISSQMPAAKKMEMSHHVAWTEGRIEVHEEQLRRIIELDGCGPWN